MDDREFVAAFESCTLPGAQFDHRQHIRLAWLYLRDPGDALSRFRQNLIRYATSLGAATKYDEHITRTLLDLIASREPSSYPTFDAFMEANGDLMEWRTRVRESESLRV